MLVHKISGLLLSSDTNFYFKWKIGRLLRDYTYRGGKERKDTHPPIISIERFLTKKSSETNFHLIGHLTSGRGSHRAGVVDYVSYGAAGGHDVVTVARHRNTLHRHLEMLNSEIYSSRVK